ncbi:phosphoribosylformylglycinamidine synthase subunit PurQ [Paracoccaceae bacterium GXU_MW_L88]
MKAAVLVFPGSNCDRDLAVAFRAAGFETEMVWHKDAALPKVDLVGVPGGFSFGDYLRCGAIAARAPIMSAVKDHAKKGGYVLGICNGFQILTEAEMLPGALLRNAQIKYRCHPTPLKVETTDSPFTSQYRQGQTVNFPVAHHDGNYRADEELVKRLYGEGRVAFSYAKEGGINGAAGHIAGVLSENRHVLGLMPHPERAADPALGGTDGKAMFAGLAESLAAVA